MLHLIRRHSTDCKHKAKGAAYKKCGCIIWAEGSLNGKRFRKSLDTTNWDIATERIYALSVGKDEMPTSVVDAVDKFLKDNERRGLAKSGMDKYKSLLNSLKKFCVGQGISSISAFDVPTTRKYVETFTSSSLVQSKNIERLRTFFKFCVGSKWIVTNPATEIKKPKVTNPPVVPFAEDEHQKILAACEQYPEKNSYGHDNRKRIKAFVMCLRYTGLRIGDVVKLERSQVVDGILTLRTTKTKSTVRLPLPQILVDALKAIENGSPYYFWTGTGGKGSLNMWDNAFRSLLKIAGVKGHAHQYRHMMATDLLSRGVPVDMVAAILGNSPAIVTKHYSQWCLTRQKALEEAIQRIW